MLELVVSCKSSSILLIDHLRMSMSIELTSNNMRCIPFNDLMIVIRVVMETCAVSRGDMTNNPRTFPEIFWFLQLFHKPGQYAIWILHDIVEKASFRLASCHHYNCYILSYPFRRFLIQPPIQSVAKVGIKTDELQALHRSRGIASGSCLHIKIRVIGDPSIPVLG